MYNKDEVALERERYGTACMLGPWKGHWIRMTINVRITTRKRMMKMSMKCMEVDSVLTFLVHEEDTGSRSSGSGSR